MPWKKPSDLAPQVAFIHAELQRSVPFRHVCHLHAISRKTGYKWWRRFLRHGHAGLRARSSRPHRLSRRRPEWLRLALQQARRRHPTWGAKKLLWVLRKKWPRRRLPHPRTVERWQPRMKRRRRARRAPRVAAPPRQPVRQANDVWTIDFKGWFRTDDRTRIDPLTGRDLFSRFVLLVAPVPAQSDRVVRRLPTALFRRRGLPRAIRVDNGPPFGGSEALGLTTLSVWWLRLGVQVEFGRPAHPQDNGAHEQMHRVLQAETARPPATHARAQLRRFRAWTHPYNYQRPHEALHLTVPAAHYRRSRRRWPRRLPEWRYPAKWSGRRVSRGGWISWAGRRRLIGRAFAGERITLRARRDHHEVYLGPHWLGQLYPHDSGGLRPIRRHATKP